MVRTVLVAAQDERFLGGSAGANHADTLRRLFELGRAERPAAVVVLAASGGVRLHEANAAEWALARALAALLDLRAAGVPVLVAGVADVFGGASVLACAAQRIALTPGVRLGLSGPAVIETARGTSELDAGDAATVARVFGAEARAAAGHVELLADSADDVRRWIARGIKEPTPLAAWVQAMQVRLAARLADAFLAGTPASLSGPTGVGAAVSAAASAEPRVPVRARPTGRSRRLACAASRRSDLAVPTRRSRDVRAARGERSRLGSARGRGGCQT